ncbi:MAG TPA: DUF5916 domain-containing protein [Thermoanaerobaculia bacterium]|nr:DUF5916 domain-containing protein [Thermoanaerobaculia bacterium]
MFPRLAGLCLGVLLAAPLVAQPPGPRPGQPPQAPLPPRPSLAALKALEPIKLDGLLDEPVWQEAQAGTDFIQREPNPGQPATEATEVRVVYTDTALYIGIRALASDPGAVVAEEMQRDGALFRDDSVLVLLDTFNDNRNAYFFEVNPNGAFTDALVTDEGRDFNVQWDAVWRAVGKRTPEGWSAEMEIPFATLRFDPNQDTWGLQVRRLIRHKNEEVFWASIPLEAGLFRVSLAGELTGIRGPEPGLNLRIKPFAVGSASNFRTPTGRVSDDDLEAGLDIKWGLTRTTTLDLTYNTDFAEVEVDDQQINLTRFSLFFPEKRDFFLENAGIFEFGFNPPGTPFLKPFFSRRIGVSPFGTVVPMEWGARLTGRQGPWSFGLLDAQTDNYDLPSPFFEQPEDNWGVVRVKRNVGQRSNIGMIFTNRDQEEGISNQVFGLDLNYNPNRYSNLSAFVTRSATDIPFAGFENRDGWAGGARAAWQGPVTGVAFDFLQIDEGYEPSAGFLLRSDIRRYVPRFTYNPRPKTQGRVRNYIYGVTGDVITDLDNETQTIEVGATLFGLRLQSEDAFSVFADHTVDRVPAAFSISPGVVVPAGEYTFNDAGITFATNNSRRFGVDGFVLAGEYYGGDRLSSAVTLGIRASRYLRSDTTWVYNDIELPGGAFTANIVRQRIGLSFSPTLFTNSYIQYNDLAELLSLNLRFNWLYRPGADLFIVFNQNWNAPSFSDLSEGDREVILKFTYLLEI